MESYGVQPLLLGFCAPHGGKPFGKPYEPSARRDSPMEVRQLQMCMRIDKPGNKYPVMELHPGERIYIVVLLYGDDNPLRINGYYRPGQQSMGREGPVCRYPSHARR